MHTALKKRQSRQVIVKPSLHFTTVVTTAMTVFSVDFANGQISAQRLALKKLSRKASYLTICDQIDDMCENRYGVPNSDSTEKYDVDATLGCCSCKAGMFGKFCKHLFAVMILFQEAFPNAPGVAADTRHSIAYIALGETFHLCTSTTAFRQQLCCNVPSAPRSGPSVPPSSCPPLTKILATRL